MKNPSFVADGCLSSTISVTLENDGDENPASIDGFEDLETGEANA